MLTEKVTITEDFSSPQEVEEKIKDFLKKTASPIVVFEGDDSNLIAVNRKLAGSFHRNDGVELAGELLYRSWGANSFLVFVKMNGWGFNARHDIGFGWRFRTVLQLVVDEEIKGEIKKALTFKRSFPLTVKEFLTTQ